MAGGDTIEIHAGVFGGEGFIKIVVNGSETVIMDVDDAKETAIGMLEAIKHAQEKTSGKKN